MKISVSLLLWAGSRFLCFFVTAIFTPRVIVNDWARRKPTEIDKFNRIRHCVKSLCIIKIYFVSFIYCVICEWQPKPAFFYFFKTTIEITEQYDKVVQNYQSVERRHWRRSVVFIGNFGQISYYCVAASKSRLAN